MKAYEQGITKEQFVAEMKWHQEQDNFLKGTYGDQGNFTKGCAVGCGLNSVARIKNTRLAVDNHKELESHLGIPEWLARVQDTIFEGVSVEYSKQWPVKFAEAINQGADLEKAKAPFLIVVLNSALESFDHARFPEVKKVIETVKHLYKSGEKDLQKFRDAARADACAAARADAYAAARAAYAAANAANAANAAYAAAYAAYAYAAARADAERANRFEYFAEELLKILRETK